MQRPPTGQKNPHSWNKGRVCADGYMVYNGTDAERTTEYRD